MTQNEETLYDKLSKIILDLESKGLIIKEATFQNRRIEYCRGTLIIK
jgi:hypothetical protein